jgi:YidC/Oxa1 family membrane protein insertase
MDKKSITGFVLIFAVVVGWMLWQQSTYKPPVKTLKKLDTASISHSVKADSAKLSIPDSTNLQSIDDSTRAVRKFGKSFVALSEGNEQIITVENDLLIAEISTKGASIIRWELKNFKKWDKIPTQLIRGKGGEAFLSFITYDGVKIDSRDLYFTMLDQKKNIRLKGDQKITLEFVIKPEINKSITKRLTFYGNKYSFDADIITANMETIIPTNKGYNLVWENGLSYQEQNSVDEASDAHAAAQLNGDIAELNADKDQPVETKETGIIDYIGIKTKYFGVAIIPDPWQSFDGTADLYGKRKWLKDNGQMEIYSMSLRIPMKNGIDERKFQFYIGPLDYTLTKSYKIQGLVNFGWKYGIRQIGEYFMHPILKFIHNFVSNYGISIIIFSIIMKFLLYPLSIQQMRSARKMQLLAPEMNKIREKYKDDNMKQQQEIMKLNSEYGINPAGGCLPMLAQMPILIALWQLLRSNIDLRQANFFWWINDLSVYDSIISWDYPIIGISHLSGLALLMGIAMFFQQKMTITDPKQKSMMYMMPVMFTFMFSSFPSGLNLYYFMFNILSIGQQVYINKFSKYQPSLAEMKRAPKKEGWLQKKMSEAQKIAESQGRKLPGSSAPRSNQTSSNNKKKPNPKK